MPPSNQELFQACSKIVADRGLKRIPAKRNPAYKASGPKSYLWLLHKFNITPTMPGPYTRGPVTNIEQRGLAGGAHALGGRAHLAANTALFKELASGKVGEVTSEDQQYDSLYLSPVQIGTPAQTLMLDFDTGSSDLWVFSSKLPTASQKGHVAFDPTKSSTWQTMPGYAWKISYGDGSSASGTCGKDTIGLGGLQVENQCVELATTMSQSFVSGSGDGLLGLGFGSINTVTHNGQRASQATPVENMIEQGDIPQTAELFTSCMYSERDAGKESFYTFGFIDQDLVTASGTDILWTPIDNSGGWWQFPSESYTVNGTTYKQAGNTAIADTGTTLALISDAACKNIYAAIPGATYSNQAQGYLVPFSVTAGQLPAVTVAVGGNQFMIQPEDLVFAPYDSNNWYGAIQSRGSLDFDILGDAFLKSIYAIWDEGNLRFGAVPKIEKVQNLTPPSNTAGATQ